MVIIDKPTGYNGIMNMQDMTDTVCKGAAIGTSGKLRDTRDSKVYWVTRLADGNCWMTQNLDLDLSDEINLTSADTDIDTAWTPITTQTTKPAFAGSTNIVQSFDPGYYLYTKPNEQNSCGTVSDLTGCLGWVNIYSNATWASSSDPNFTSPFDSATNTYNAHYLVGNYYSWGAATAGQAANFTANATAEATQSICPKGWRLPINSGNKSYNALLTSYGANNGLLYGTQDIRLAPLYFVYGGRVNSSSLEYAGSHGRYWSSTAYSSANAYNLRFDSSVDPSTSSARYYGYSVRCVAR